MTAARVLDELLAHHGVDVFLTAEGKVRLRGRPFMVDRVSAFLDGVDRDALRAELLRRDDESRERLADVLGPTHPATHPRPPLAP